LLQVTLFSDQFPAIRRAWRVRPFFQEAAYRRSVADWTVQPAGMLAGMEKRIRARKLLFDLPWTLRIESVPLLLELPCSTQASTLALTVTVVAVQAGIGVLVGVAVGGTGVLVGVAVAVGGTGVLVGVAVAVGGTGVLVGVAVAVGGSDVAVGVASTIQV
jgi:hypothetical protein